MGVLIIGIATMSVLVWVLASSLAAECNAEKRRVVQVGEFNTDRNPLITPGRPNQAA